MKLSGAGGTPGLSCAEVPARSGAGSPHRPQARTVIAPVRLPQPRSPRAHTHPQLRAPAHGCSAGSAGSGRGGDEASGGGRRTGPPQAAPVPSVTGERRRRRRGTTSLPAPAPPGSGGEPRRRLGEGRVRLERRGRDGSGGRCPGALSGRGAKVSRPEPCYSLTRRRPGPGAPCPGRLRGLPDELSHGRERRSPARPLLTGHRAHTQT